MYIEDKDNYDVLDGAVDHQEEKPNDKYTDIEDVETDILLDGEGEEIEPDIDGLEEEVVEPQEGKSQSQQENANYKKMRLRIEKETREKIEAELSEERTRIESMKMAAQQELAEKKIINSYLNPQKIQDYADERGVSDDIAREMLQHEAQRLIDGEKHKLMESNRLKQTTKASLRKDKYFSILEPEVESILEANPGADFKAVYAWQRLERQAELDEQLAKSVEKRTIANLQDRSRRKNVGTSAGSTDTTYDMSDFGKQFAISLGVDPREAAKVNKERGRNKRRN